MAKAELFEKDIPKEERVIFYDSLETDPIKTKEQEKKVEVKLPEDYVFIHKNPFYAVYAWVLYHVIFRPFARWYLKFYLHGRIVGREKLKKYGRRGCVIYANHTNPFHDAFSPAVVSPKHIRVIISPVNLLIPGIGKLLPALGAMPLGASREKKKEMNEAVDKRISQGEALVVYPEAHVWPYYTGIRPFPAGDKNFKYPVRNKCPTFTMTTTYQKPKNKNRERPDMTIFVDGPFYANEKKNEDEQRAELCKKVEEALKKAAKKSNYEYFVYKKATKEKLSRDKRTKTENKN